MGLSMDRDFAAAIAPMVEATKDLPKPKAHDIETRRQRTAAYDVAQPIPGGVEHNIYHIPTADGYQLPVYHFKKQGPGDQSLPGPAVIHAHGGGLIALSAKFGITNLSQHVLDTGVQFFSVDYRLAPEHPYPTPLEDCWTALTWVISKASEFGVDKSRVGVMGESAGGGLAAGLALLARDRQLSPPLARQILSYPMLDDRSTEKVEPGVFSLWDEVDNITGWKAYLGSKVGGDDVPIFAAPGRVKDVSGLPPLYVEVGQLDIFLPEVYAYAAKFIGAKIETECHIYPGLPHGYEFVPTHIASINSRQNRNEQLKKL